MTSADRQMHSGRAEAGPVRMYVGFMSDGDGVDDEVAGGITTATGRTWRANTVGIVVASVALDA